MAEQDQEKTYEVTDKRKVKLDENGEVQAEPETPAEQPSPEPEGFEDLNLPPVDVYALIKSFIGVLGMQTWQWLGLVKNPVTGQMEKDLSQAKVAIDTISALVSQIESKLEPGEQRELMGMLSDLRINFVQQSSK